MGYRKENCIPIFVTALSQAAPADSTDYYIGNTGMTPTSTANFRKIYIPKNGTIRIAQLRFNYDVDATNEAVTVAIVKNNTTTYTLTAALDMSVHLQTELNLYDLNIPVSKGDYIELKYSTPAWVTNPTNLRIAGNLILEY